MSNRFFVEDTETPLLHLLLAISVILSFIMLSWLVKRIKEISKQKELSMLTETRPQNLDFMCELPEDLIGQILVRLPEESLMRFKSVCRAWNAKIDSPSFVRSYGDCKYSSKKVMIYTGGEEPPIYSFSINCKDDEETLENIPHNFGYSQWSRDYQVVGSCDGLLCVYVKKPRGLWIWNPSTRQYRILPSPKDDSSYRCCTRYGFGCVDSSKESNYKDYKVVRIHGDGKFQIYTTCMNSWETREDIPYRINRDSFALVNAKLHFLGRKLIIVGEDITEGESVFLAFDIENEEFREVPRPNYDDGCSHFSGSELNRKLCIARTRLDQTKTSVWVMKEYGVKDSWTKMFCVDITKMMYLGGVCSSVQPLHFYVDGKILLHAKYENFCGDIEDEADTEPNNLLVYYDSRNQKVRIPKLDGIPIRYFTANYVETFISPDSILPC